MKATYSETSVDFQRTTRLYIPDDMWTMQLIQLWCKTFCSAIKHLKLKTCVVWNVTLSIALDVSKDWTASIFRIEVIFQYGLLW
jgi:hypothetical protein